MHVASAGRIERSAEVVERLIAARASVNVRDRRGRLPLHVCTYPPVAKLLLDSNSKVSIEMRDSEGKSPLHYYCEAEGDGLALVEMLLAQGANVNNAPIETGVNALISLCNSPLVSQNAPDVLQLLLKSGATCDTDPRGCMTAVFACTRYGHIGLLTVLLKARPDLLESQDALYRFPIHEAATSEVAQALLELAADLHAVDDKRATPLHLALRYGRKEVVGTLLRLKADPWKKDVHGIAAVDSCRDPQCWEVLKAEVQIDEYCGIGDDTFSPQR